MLETTLKTEFVPGTNLTGGLACAAWRFLLPSLGMDRILCLGVPPTRTLEVLSRIARQLTMIAPDESCSAQQTTSPEATANARFMTIAELEHGSLPANSIDLLVFAGRCGMHEALRDRRMQDQLIHLMKADGTFVFETSKLSDHRLARRLLKNLRTKEFGVSQSYWLTPFSGELRTAFPMDDKPAARFLFKNVLFGQSLKKRVLSQVGRSLSSTGLVFRTAPRRLFIVQKTQDHSQSGVPAYITSVAKGAGVDLTKYRCGLSSRGKYNSNKTIFYLFNPHSAEPAIVVKMTRAAEFNPRLENEYRVLAELSEKGYAERGTFPQPLFFGYHAGLAIVGQKAVQGEPFRNRTQATVDCPIARQALAWMMKLAVNSAPEARVPAATVQGVLATLLKRFAAIYPLPEKELAVLKEQIQIMGSSLALFPAVLQHGDPGTWNMLVSEEGKVIVIDWEAGEPQGMPLWDLFYFMRSYGNWMARREGIGDSLKSFTKMFIEPSPLGTLLHETVDQYCYRTGLDHRLVEPLFHFCWLHRALKESTRLTSATLKDGHYYNLLRLCLERRNAEGLRALFAVGRPVTR